MRVVGGLGPDGAARAVELVGEPIECEGVVSISYAGDPVPDAAPWCGRVITTGFEFC